MGQAGRECRNATPLRITPDLGQVPENRSKPSTKEAWDIFQDEDGAWKVSGQTLDMDKQAGSLSVDTISALLDRAACLGNAGILEGKAATDEIGNNSVCSKTVSGKISHIVISGDGRPVPCKDGARIFFDLAECDCSHPGSFESE
jgi:hypothetical protein